MMAACVAIGETTSVWQYDAYCMPIWVADLMVLIMMMMGDVCVPVTTKLTFLACAPAIALSK
jgi:hypothetical protein